MSLNPAFHERNTNISLRISPNFKLGVMNAAKDLGVSISDYVEGCIAAFENEKVKTKECETHLKTIAQLRAQLADLEAKNAEIAKAFSVPFQKSQTSEAPIFKNAKPQNMHAFLLLVAKTVKV
jgi:hypothetical protein